MRFSDEWNLYNPFRHQLDRKLVTCWNFPFTQSEATDLALGLAHIQHFKSLSLITYSHFDIDKWNRQSCGPDAIQRIQIG